MNHQEKRTAFHARFKAAWESLDPASRPLLVYNSGRLVDDLRRGVRLRICYRRSEDIEATWRVIDPYGLLAKAGRWYLVADSVGRPQLHALERIVGWEPMRAARRMRPDVTLESVASELTAYWERPEAFQIHAELDSNQLSRARRILGSRLTIRDTAGAQRVRITVTGRVHPSPTRRVAGGGVWRTGSGRPGCQRRSARFC